MMILKTCLAAAALTSALLWPAAHAAAVPGATLLRLDTAPAGWVAAPGSLPAADRVPAIGSTLPGVGDTPQTFVLAPGEGSKTYSLSLAPSAAATDSLSFATSGPATTEHGAFPDSALISAVPEPATYGLLIAGLVGLHVVASRRLRSA